MSGAREDLESWLLEALTTLGGRGSIVEGCKKIWEKHESDLRNSADLFYTWQYDVRWTANRLRRARRMKSVEQSDPHIWELAPDEAVIQTAV